MTIKKHFRLWPVAAAAFVLCIPVSAPAVAEAVLLERPADAGKKGKTTQRMNKLNSPGTEKCMIIDGCKPGTRKGISAINGDGKSVGAKGLATPGMKGLATPGVKTVAPLKR